jgi:hypothetical protein
MSLWVMCGQLRVGKDFLHVLQHWSVQPCVRPFDAVHMTAGHNALRGSGPDQTRAFDNASTTADMRRLQRRGGFVPCMDLWVAARWADRLIYLKIVSETWA